MEYSSNFKKVIKQAESFSDGLITPVHLFRGIMSVKDCRGFSILTKVIDIDDTEKRMNDMIGGNPVSDNNDKKVARLTMEAENIMMQSQLEAKKFNSTIVRTEHLVLAMSRARIIDVVPYKDIEKLVNDMYELTDENGNNDSNLKEQNKPSSNKKTKTPLLDEFCTDLTKLAKEGKLDPTVGRKKELRRIAQVLSRRKKNNPVLIGDPGVGKTSIVDGLAQMIVNKQTPDVLFDKRVLSLEMGSIVAGTKYRGEFEERMKKIVDELKSNNDIILFIDEIHTIVGAGGSSGSLDAANILKPALSRGEISCIGSTTNEEYKKIEKDGALDRRFQKIRVYEPTYNETREILEQLKERYEDFHLVEYTDEAIEACLKLSDRYISDRKFPDKAIDAMDEAGSSVHISQEVPKEIGEKELEIESTVKKKLSKVTTQDFEGAAEEKKKEDSLRIELDELKKRIKDKKLSTRAKVTADHIAEVISIMTGIPSKNITDDDTTKIIQLETNIKKVVVGQDDAVSKISRAILRNKAGLGDVKKPIGTFLFLGPTGVGKTYIAKKLAEELFTTERDMIRIDMSEYMEKHSVSKLIGSPPGYVGYDDGGQLTERVRRKPYSVILLDEIEKAHQDVANILLQIFDDGILTDSQGRTVDFKNTVIIMTSNIGSREAKARGNGIGFTEAITGSMAKSVVDKELKRKFAPEFLNRIDEIISFNSLDKDNIKNIIDIEIAKFITRLKDNGIELELDETTKDFLFEKGWDADMGARPLKRAIQKYIEDEISVKLITKEIKVGDKIKVVKSLTEDNLEFLTVTNLLDFNVEGTTSTSI
jgi:ATP-dependent Clp protease ATP-binding subunit ClpC